MRGYYETSKQNTNLSKTMKVSEEAFWDTFPQLLVDDPIDANGELVSILRAFAHSWFAGETEEAFIGRYFDVVESRVDEYDGVGV